MLLDQRSPCDVYSSHVLNIILPLPNHCQAICYLWTAVTVAARLLVSFSNMPTSLPYSTHAYDSIVTKPLVCIWHIIMSAHAVSVWNLNVHDGLPGFC